MTEDKSAWGLLEKLVNKLVPTILPVDYFSKFSRKFLREKERGRAQQFL